MRHRTDTGLPLFLEAGRAILTVPGHEAAAWWDTDRGQTLRLVPFRNDGSGRISCLAEGSSPSFPSKASAR